jgi:hypothetical protein
MPPSHTDQISDFLPAMHEARSATEPVYPTTGVALVADPPDGHTNS